MERHINIVEIMRFILNSGKPKAFPFWRITDIFDYVLFSLVTGNILVCAEEGEITGILLFRINDRIFHISHIIVKTKTALKKFIGYYKLRYSACCVEGERRGKVRVYNKLERTLNLIQRL